MPSSPFFLDHHSTTPVDIRVFEAMRPWFLTDFGNPHSSDHAYGWRSEAAVEGARREIAGLIGATASEIIFTSGATESNNLGLQGVAATLPEARRHVIVSATGHPCITGVGDLLEARGFAVTRAAPDPDGRYSVTALERLLRPDTGLVSIEWAHHEYGTIQPIPDIGALLKSRNIVFHSDAAQAAGKIAIDVGETVDLLSLSAHKLYGPKGIGALYVRRRPGLTLVPLFAGGGQQRGIRPGTIPTPLAVGFGEACRIAGLDMTNEATRLSGLRDRLLDGLTAAIPGLALNGTLEHRLPHNLSLRLPGLAAVDFLYAVKDDIAMSAGSACASAVIEPSPSLLALGLSEADALSSIRIGLGRTTTPEHIETAIAVITAAYGRLTRLGEFT